MFILIHLCLSQLFHLSLGQRWLSFAAGAVIAQTDSASKILDCYTDYKFSNYFNSRTNFHIFSMTGTWFFNQLLNWSILKCAFWRDSATGPIEMEIPNRIHYSLECY